MDEIKNQIQNNKIIEKVKYIPKLKNELRDLEFDPNEINDIKNKLKYYNMERENLTQKFRKEVKELQNKKKDNLKSYKNIEETIKKIEKQNNNLQNQFSNLKEEDINEGNTFIEEINSMKDKINTLESQLKDINLNKINLKHKYNEEVELFKITYNKTKGHPVNRYTPFLHLFYWAVVQSCPSQYFVESGLITSAGFSAIRGCRYRSVNEYQSLAS